MTQLTSTGEIMALNEADQFQPGKSQFECGFFSCAMVRSAAPPGHAPIRTVQQVIDDGEMWYGQYDGDTSINNTDGMTLPQLYALIKQMTYGYVAIDLGNDPMGYIKGWIRNGYPVIVAVDETALHDLALGGAVPYPWTPAGSHVIVITGIASDGNFLVRDSANCTSLYDANSLRPGPRRYNAGQLVGGLVSATAVVTYWLPTPPSGFDPRKGNIMPVPQGWHYDSTRKVLTAPNGVQVAQGFCQAILSESVWDGGDQPFEPEYHADVVQLHAPEFGGGQRLVTRDHMLWWTQAKGVIIEKQMGNELHAAYAEIARLKNIVASQPAPGTDLQAIKNKLSVAETSVASLDQALKDAIAAIPAPAQVS